MSKRLTRTLITVGLAGALVTVGAFGFASTQRGSTSADAISITPPSDRLGLAGEVANVRGASLVDTIERLQTHLATTPGDDVSWATLGLAYVQQARITVNAEFYPRAEQALDESFSVNDTDNYLGYAGRSSLASARHDFTAAREFALAGLKINPYSNLLYGALSDAETQLGHYDAAFDAVQKMLDLSPDTASLSRASYTFELRGDVAQATVMMQRALDDSPTPADRAFALHHLAMLAFDNGDPNRALELELQALAASPDDPAARFGRVIAEAALGQTDTALEHLEALVRSVPEPSYLVYYGTLLDSLGRHDEADAQYAVVDVTRQLFAANGVLPDADAVLFEVSQGNIDQALGDAQAALVNRPFLAMHDAYAWALSAAGRHDEALVEMDKALALGTRNALFHYHAGMIRLAAGDAEGARTELTEALAINPHFDPVAAPLAARQLADLGGTS
jgi:tetratricopeptide (TPR) repeat protein